MFESLGEEILPNPPSTSCSVEFNTNILPHSEESLESPITLENFGDDPLNHSYILHQHPSPFDIVVVQAPCCLGEHQFIIS